MEETRPVFVDLPDDDIVFQGENGKYLLRKRNEMRQRLGTEDRYSQQPASKKT